VDLAIRTTGLTKTFKGVEAVRGIDLEVPKNTIFGFLGPNGAGKTTTIKLLLGLARPTAGQAEVFGQDIGRDTLEIRRRVGYLAQEPRYYEHMTARETLRFTARFFYTGPAAAIQRRVGETLELVGLADKADRPIRGFSGGERQRLGIAQAQINRPDLLILDEPAASLDPMGRRDVLEVMNRLRSHTTIFYSTHILDDVQRVSDTVAIMHQGRLAAQAPIGDLLAGVSGEEVYVVGMKGDVAEARARVEALPWVHGVEDGKAEGRKNGVTEWHVRVTDAEAAEAQLLRTILSSERVTVTGFGRHSWHLEDVFMRIVGEAGS
jgi:ABC-2 type transport system ATP-binding protein